LPPHFSPFNLPIEKMKAATTLEKPKPASRRSQRLKLQVPVLVTRQAPNQRPAREDAVTLNVNACGGMFELRMPLERGDLLIVLNKATTQEQEARVVYIGPNAPHGRKIGVEFTEAARDFWRICFPRPRANGH
jgi:hypothetical protein